MTIEQAEKELYYVYERPSEDDYMTHLVRAIMRANEEQRELLSKSYPNLVDVVRRYQTESGYFDSLIKKI